MRFHTIQRILGLLLMVSSATMLPPLLLALWFGDGSEGAFSTALLSVLAAGAVFWLPVRGQRTKTNARTRKGPRKTVAGKKGVKEKR